MAMHNTWSAAFPGTTATLVVAGDGNRTQVKIANNGAAAVYLGPSNVTTTTGFPLAASTTVTFDSADPIYGVVASGTGDCRVLSIGY